MMKTIITTFILLFTLPVFAKVDTSQPETKCRLNFELKSWAIFYKKGDGSGTVTCDNGQRVNVIVQTRGGGLSFGKTKITDGEGTFTHVHDINEVLGSYATSEAHAGVAKSVDAQAMTNGDVSLSLTAKGKGVDIGIAFGSFKLIQKGNIAQVSGGDPVIQNTNVTEPKKVKSSSGVVEKDLSSGPPQKDYHKVQN
ncbi:hypothetical protein K1X76_06820 [bacterium]|nr:hypothetical protein [bacterium]